MTRLVLKGVASLLRGLASFHLKLAHHQTRSGGRLSPEPLDFWNGIMPKRDESADKRFHGIYASARFAGITDKEFKGLMVDHCGVFTDLDAVRSERFVTATRFLDRPA